MPRIHILLACLLALALAACATTDREPTEADAPEDEEEEKDEDDVIDLGEVFGIEFGSSDDDEEQEGPGAEPFARAEDNDAIDDRAATQEEARREALSEGEAVPAPEGRDGSQVTGPAVGLLFGNERAAAADHVVDALRRAAGDHPFSVADPEAVAGELDRQGCRSVAAERCADALARTPGVRVLVVVSGFDGVDGDAESVRTRLIDTELGGEPVRVPMQLPVRDGAVPEPALAAWADAVFVHAAELTAPAPAIYRAVEPADEEDVWRLSQGREAGLETGDRLLIHPTGRLVRAAAGAGPAWVPAPAVGELEVIETEATSARARLVAGEGPRPSDRLVPRR